MTQIVRKCKVHNVCLIDILEDVPAVEAGLPRSESGLWCAAGNHSPNTWAVVNSRTGEILNHGSLNV